MSHVKWGSRSVVVLALVVACMLAWVAPVFATETSTGRPAESSTAVSTETKTLSSSTTRASASGGSADAKGVLILDASYSMVEEDAEGRRIDAAKKATRELVDFLPETAQMGLIAYGAQESNAPDNREKGCKDIERLVPIGKVDKQKFGAAIDGLTPKGYTPMGNALRKAAEQLGSDGERSIILVSDGIDTCAPPEVCDVAKELAGDGVDLAIHTVGFKADEEARAELECIAEAGGGQFLEAADASSLAQSLKFLSQRGVEKYQTGGTEFEFSDTPEDAKWLGEGQYQTTVTPDQGTPKDRYFRISVPPRHHARVVFSPVWQTDGMWEAGHLKIEPVEVTNEGDAECGWFPGKHTAFVSAGPDYGIESATVSVERNGESDMECDMSDILVKTQISDVEGVDTGDIGLEVSVFYEPIPSDEQKTAWSDGKIIKAGDYLGEMPMKNPEPISGGTGFNDAVDITEGTYSDNIIPGEFRFYKIPVAYGQRPVVKVKTPESVAHNADSLGFGIYDPMRNELVRTPLNFFMDAAESDAETLSQYVWHDTNTPYQGEYYVWLGMGWVHEGYDIAGVEQPFEFEVAMDGEPGNGGPDWTPTHEDGPEPSDEPIKFEAVDDTAETSASQASEESDDSDTEVNAAEDDEAGGFGLVPGLLVGLVVLLLVAVAVVFVVARGRR